MGALLIEGWIDGRDAIAIADDASIAMARDAVREVAAAIGMTDVTRRESIVAATSELARNQLVHATGGVIAVRAIARGGVAGIEVTAADHGPGIADPAAALAGVPRVAGSLGVGLSAAYRQVDEMDVDVRWGEGTCIRARSFVAPVARSEVAIVGRPHPGEVTSGDHAAVVRRDDALVIGVADGLGHGAPARVASDRAMAELAVSADRTPVEILARCHAALAGLRGVVMAVARVEAGTLDHAGIGNIATRIYAPDGALTMLPMAGGIVGAGQLPRRVPGDRIAIASGHVLVMASDGLASRIDLSRDPVVRRPALAIAHYLVETYGRDSDDAIVAVAR